MSRLNKKIALLLLAGCTSAAFATKVPEEKKEPTAIPKYTCLRTLQGHTDYVLSVAFAPDSKVSMLLIRGYYRTWAGKHFVPNVIAELISEYTRRTTNILASVSNDKTSGALP